MGKVDEGRETSKRNIKREREKRGTDEGRINKI